MMDLHHMPSSTTQIPKAKSVSVTGLLINKFGEVVSQCSTPTNGLPMSLRSLMLITPMNKLILGTHLCLIAISLISPCHPILGALSNKNWIFTDGFALDLPSKRFKSVRLQTLALSSLTGKLSTSQSA